MVAGRFKVISVLAGKVKNRLRSESVDFFDCPPPRHFTGITPGAVLPPIEPVINKINFLGPLALFSSFAIHGALVVYALTFPLVSTSVPSQKTAMLLNVQLVEQVVLNDVKPQQDDVSPISVQETVNSDPQTTATINSPEEVKASSPVEVLPNTSQPDSSQQENVVVDEVNETQKTPQENVSVQNPVQILTDPPESDDVVIVGGHAVSDASSVKVAETEELTLEEPATPDYKPPQKLVAPDNPLPVRVKPKSLKGSHPVRMLREKYVAKPASPVKVSAYRDNVLNHLAMSKPLGGSGPGTVVVAFSLSKTGDLQALRVARSSGNQILEAKALNAVWRASPYPQPPQGVKRNQLLFNIPFYFQ